MMMIDESVGGVVVYLYSVGVEGGEVEWKKFLEGRRRNWKASGTI